MVANVMLERTAQLTEQSFAEPEGLALYLTGKPAFILFVLPVMFKDTVDAGLPIEPKLVDNVPVV